MIFGGYNYYPAGGMDDLLLFCDNGDDVERILVDLADHAKTEWLQVYDLWTGRKSSFNSRVEKVEYEYDPKVS
jgi:hypothetical protein